MKGSMKLAAAVATVAVLGGTAAAQQPSPKADCKANAPAKIEGQVVSVDQASRKITVREKDGKVHEFQASADMLQTTKVGDKIEATLRQPPSC